jgi:molybdopterin molybdotransferase
MSASSDPKSGAGTPFRDVRMRGFRDRTEVIDVQALLASRVQTLPFESVPLAATAGRVLSSDIVAERPVPDFDRAAMDGFALRAEETFGAAPYNVLEFVVVGEAFPGRPYPGTVGPGQAVRIMTGAPLPVGADAVLQAEAAEETSGHVRVSEAVAPARNVGRRGEDIDSGDTVLNAGRVLRPQDVGVLASMGIAAVAVIRRPTVALLITGDELLPPGTKPDGYKIVDSNSVMLDALTRRDGGVAEAALYVKDDYPAVRTALLGATADFVLVSGGSSVGQEDHAPRVLAECGELSVHGVALRPASPTGVGFLSNRPVFLLPGNPVSCLCAYDLFAGPTLRRLGGLNPDLPYRSAVLPLARKLVSAVGRVDYVRVTVREGLVEPLATSGAAILTSTTRADGFVLVDRDSEGAGPGEPVQVYLYD